jgi:hypothetical protein
MKRILAVASFLLLAAPAAAQTLGDTAIGMGAVGAATEFGVLSAPPVANGVLTDKLARQGYSNFTVPHLEPGQPLSFNATSPAGTPVQLTVDPRTGNIVSAIPQ